MGVDPRVGVVIVVVVVVIALVILGVEVVNGREANAVAKEAAEWSRSMSPGMWLPKPDSPPPPPPPPSSTPLLCGGDGGDAGQTGQTVL